MKPANFTYADLSEAVDEKRYAEICLEDAQAEMEAAKGAGALPGTIRALNDNLVYWGMRLDIAQDRLLTVEANCLDYEVV